MKKNMKKSLLLIIMLIFAENAFAAKYEAYGDGVQFVLPMVALTMSVVEEDPEGRVQFYKTFGTTFGITYTLKLGVNRTRPNGAPYSFPSGHTSASFASAGFIHQRYGVKKGIWAYIAASFVGWTRIEANKHYTSDVLAGAAIGTVTSYIFTTNENMNLSGYKDGDSTGINIEYRW